MQNTQQTTQQIIKGFEESVFSIANNFIKQNDSLQSSQTEDQEIVEYAKKCLNELKSIEKTNAAKYQALYNYFFPSNNYNNTSLESKLKAFGFNMQELETIKASESEYTKINELLTKTEQKSIIELLNKSQEFLKSIEQKAQELIEKLQKEAEKQKTQNILSNSYDFSQPSLQSADSHNSNTAQSIILSQNADFMFSAKSQATFKTKSNTEKQRGGGAGPIAAGSMLAALSGGGAGYVYAYGIPLSILSAIGVSALGVYAALGFVGLIGLSLLVGGICQNIKNRQKFEVVAYSNDSQSVNSSSTIS